MLPQHEVHYKDHEKHTNQAINSDKRDFGQNLLAGICSNIILNVN